MKILLHSIFLNYFLLVMMHSLIFAKEDNGNDSDNQSLIKKTTEIVDDTHKILSEQVSSASDIVDSFFGEERMDGDYNTSKIRLNFVTIFDDEGKATNEINLSTSLILPRTQKKLNLIVEDAKKNFTDDDLSDTGGSQKQNKGTDKSVTESTLSAALQYKIFDSKNWTIDTKTGVVFSVPFVDPYGRLRIRRSFYLENNWESRFTQLVRWSPLRDWEESSGLVFDKPINNQLLFRINNGISWRKKTRLFSLGHGYSLYHQLTSNKALEYFSSISGIHEPKIYTTGYNLGVAYRQMVYKNWIFFEISPMAVWSRGKPSESFEQTNLIKVKLEFVFGGEKTS
tara:strand:- start:1094 stop:2113 length:1020 start_codon:yes stop_codon:yes gene_type:complete